jgi:hypothetical protein
MFLLFPPIVLIAYMVDKVILSPERRLDLSAEYLGFCHPLADIPTSPIHMHLIQIEFRCKVDLIWDAAHEIPKRLNSDDFPQGDMILIFVLEILNN